MNNLLKRSLTGAVYVAVVVCSLIVDVWWAFPLLCLWLACFGLIEFYNLCNHSSNGENHRPFFVYFDSLCGLIPVALPLAMLNLGAPLACVAVYLLYIMVRLVLMLYAKEKSPIQNLAFALAGHIYVALPLGLATVLYQICGPQFLLAMFIMVWLNDTGAFLVGSAVGRRRLFERISPKKSWEGFWGGVAFSAASGVLIFYCFGDYAPAMPLWQLCVMGLLVGVFATWGDLVESLLKRTYHVKDSGSIMPGHGGILDRIDSLLLVLPMLYVYRMILWYF